MATNKRHKDTHYVKGSDVSFILREFILSHEIKYPMYANVDAPTISGKQYIVEHSGVSESMISRILNHHQDKVGLGVVDKLLCAINKPEALHTLTIEEAA